MPSSAVSAKFVEENANICLFLLRGSSLFSTVTRADEIFHYLGKSDEVIYIILSLATKKCKISGEQLDVFDEIALRECFSLSETLS